MPRSSCCSAVAGRHLGCCASAAATLAALLVVVAGAGAWPRTSGPVVGLAVTALDVGQGDAVLIRAGPTALLVDAGPPEGDVVARLRRAGVRRLDALLLSHPHRDHVGGAPALLAAVPVGAVLAGPHPLDPAVVQAAGGVGHRGARSHGWASR